MAIKYQVRQRWFPRIWTWWRAWRDAKSNIPQKDTKTLSETEQEILNSTNTTLLDIQYRLGEKADPKEAKLAKLRNDRDKIYKPEYNNLTKIAGRQDIRTHFSPVAHFILMAFLSIGEGAFNLVAFNVFHEPGPYTILMASTIAIGIPICALFIGAKLRQFPEPWWSTVLKIIVAVAGGIGMLVFIAQVRFAYLSDISPEFAKAHPELGRAFLAINIFVLFAATFITYLSKDPLEGFAEAKTKLDRVNSRISKIEGKLDHWATEFEAEVNIWKENGRSLMAFYRNVNRRYRKEKAPNYFDDPNEENHNPNFVQVRKVSQFHTSEPLASSSEPGSGLIAGKTE